MTLINAKIFGLSRHRLTTDGEGVTTLVAFSGCPLRCKYCLNKASWDMANGRDYTPETLFEEVKIDQLYFLATHGGVTFGGGEPLLQVEFIKAFRELCGPPIPHHPPQHPSLCGAQQGRRGPARGRLQETRQGCQGRGRRQGPHHAR